MARLFDDKRSAAAGTTPAPVRRTVMQGAGGRALPNSAMLSALGYADQGPDPRAALDALRAQRPDAEAEADRLSAGVTGATPEAVKAEMGERLGADLSDVRFHADAASARQGDRIAARAWTRGGDVYFGSGGFDPAVAAHELVHTVQQGAAAGQTAVAAPAGGVQMMPHPFQWIAEKYRDWKGWRAGDQTPRPAPPPPLPDSKAPELPGAQKTPMGALLPANEFAQIRLRRQQRQFLEQQEKTAHQQMIADQAKVPLSAEEKAALQKKRPWELTEVDLARSHFNPGQVDELTEIQSQIDAAKSPREAYQIFSRFAGNDTGDMVDRQGAAWDPGEVDLGRFQAKMKNMARMVHDYPELRGYIGNMHETVDDQMTMGMTPTHGGTRKARLYYNAFFDSRANEKAMRGDYDDPSNGLTADESYSGNHELGHVLNSLMLTARTRRGRDAAEKDWADHVTADKMLEGVLQRNLDPGIYENVARHKADAPKKRVRQGQIDLVRSGLSTYGITSDYGMTDAGEFFAEAFRDVYANGAKAKPASIDLVRSYEERTKAKRKKQS